MPVCRSTRSCVLESALLPAPIPCGTCSLRLGVFHAFSPSFNSIAIAIHHETNADRKKRSADRARTHSRVERRRRKEEKRQSTPKINFHCGQQYIVRIYSTTFVRLASEELLRRGEHTYVGALGENYGEIQYSLPKFGNSLEIRYQVQMFCPFGWKH